MKERPILFSAPMVRAILDGRKTQTRRVINPQPIWVADPSVPFKTTDADPMGIINCQHGKPGDRLWVRETWQGYKRVSYEYNEWEEAECVKDVAENGYTSFVYKADGKNFPDKWLPSIHMPRIASRITLESLALELSGCRILVSMMLSRKVALNFHSILPIHFTIMINLAMLLTRAHIENFGSHSTAPDHGI